MIKNAWRILLVDDDEEDYFLTREMLASIPRRRYILEWRSTFASGWQALQTGDYDAALVDYDLGLHSGIEFISRAVAQSCAIPILMVTGRGSYEVDVEAMEAGAEDYLSKADLNPALLERAIRYAIERKSSQTALAEANLQLQKANLALKDARKAAEKAAAEAQQAARDARASYIRMEAVINNLTDLVLVVDKDDQVTLANSFAIAMLGFDPVRQSSETMFNKLTITDDDGNPIPAQTMPFNRARKDEIVLNFPMTIRNARGRLYHILASAMPLYIGREFFGVVTVWDDITETRKNEAQLREQKRVLETTNQQLQGFFDHAPAGMVLYDAEPPYRVLMHNRIFQEFWPEPFHSQGMLGKYITDFAPGAEEEGILEVYREVARTGEGKTLYNTPYDGMPRGRTWWNWTVSPIFDDGKVMAFAHMLIEVTNEVLARQQIEKERARLEGILDSLPLATWISDAQGRIIQTNHEADVIWHGNAPHSEGIDAYREYKARWPDTGKPVQPDEWPMAVALREGKRIVGLELQIERFDGTTGSVLVSGAPFYDANGELLGSVAVDLDITERKQLESELRQSEERFRVALQNIPISVFTLDTSRRYTWIYNPQLGYTVEQVLGKRDDELLPLDQAAEMIRLKQRVIDSGVTVNQEVQLTLDGQQAVFILSAEPLYNAEGTVCGLIGTSMDITRQRQLEKQQIEFHTQMEVQHRLLEHRERERQEIARELHDGPIQNIVGTLFSIQSAKDRVQDEETIQTMEDISAGLRSAVQELRGMVNEFRPPVLIRYGLSRAIQIHAEDLRARHPELKVDLDLIEDENILAEDTCLALYRVYQEAVNNIIRHAQASMVWIRYYPLGDRMVLEIKDNGVGFTPPTEWLDLTHENHFGVVGMKERIEALEGTIKIDSAPGQGTNVKFMVPIKKRPPAAAAAAPAP